MERHARLIVLLIGFPVLTVFYFIADARHVSFLPTCPFYYLTGLYCPGCGSQRAFSSLLHGDIFQAINYNILLVLSLPFLICSAAVFVLNYFRKKQYSPKLFYSFSFVKIVLVVTIGFWILRNIPQSPFSLLSPHSG